MTPLISIITVTYNAQKNIGKTLSSIKSQNFTDFEFIVIDGASSDNTVSLVNEVAIPNTKILSEPDGGLYDAMNKGLSMASGRYVLFLNAGDSFHTSSTLARYGEEAAKDRDIIYGDTEIVDSKGESLGLRHLSVPAFLTKESFSNGMLICHQAFMVKKQIVPEYNLNYRFSADYDWCVRCLSKSSPDNCVNLNEIVIDYLNDGLTDNNKFKSLKERFIIMKRHYGLPKTIMRHIGFVARAIKRGKI